MDEDFDIELFKKGIAEVESSGGKNLVNSASSAAGKYQFLYRQIKNDPDMVGVSKREFNNSEYLQEKIMDKALNGKLEGFPGYKSQAKKIKAEYNLDARNDEVAALVHYLGPTGARRYYKNPTGYKPPGKTNANVSEYLDKYNKSSKQDMPAPRQPLVGNGDNSLQGAPVNTTTMLPNQFAEGGQISSGTPVNTELVRFENGGTHEQNPHGGIPLGFGDNGKQNTVEEGETKYDFAEGSYIFSNRLGLGDYSYKTKHSPNQFAEGGYTDPYKVQKGDTLSKIAKSKGTSLRDILKHNPNLASNPDMINIGQSIDFDYLKNKAIDNAQSSSSYGAGLSQPSQQASMEPKTFNEAFKVYREKLGPNKIFEFQGRKYGTNLAGEEFNPSESELSTFGMNKESVKKRLKKQNKEVKSPFTSKDTTKLESEYKSWEEVKERKSEINKMSQTDRIRSYYKSSGKKGNFIVIDKKKGLAHVYNNSSDEPLYSTAIDVGKNPGDAQTVTKIDRNAADKNKDNIISKKEASVAKADFSKGNKSTGAGRYKISSISKSGYGGKPLLNLVNEAGNEVATSFHKGFVDDGISRVSNGCIRCKPQTLDFLSNNMVGGEEVFILPEDEGNEFVFENGKLNFRVNSGKDYNKYKDSKGVERKGQGINRTTSTLNYKPIKLNIDKKKFADDKFTYLDFNDEKEYNEVVVPFVKKIQDSKQKVMKIAKINGDAYNDIAMVAFGILGVESNFGDTHSAVGNLARAGMKFFDKDSSSPDYKSKEGYRDFAGRKGESTSTGLTQVRWSQTDSEDRRLLKEVGITSNKDFLDPEKSAIGTLILLSNRYKFQLNNEEKKDIMTYLPKTWNNRKNYSDRVKASSSYLSLEEKR